MFEPCTFELILFGVIHAGPDVSTDSVVLAGKRAVTTLSGCLNPMGMDKLISRINASLKTVRLGQPAEQSKGHTGHEASDVPRNSIEEFDPGSA